MSDFAWPDVLAPLLRREDLAPGAVEAAMTEILEGRANEAQIAGFGVALRAKGETVDELAALVRTMLHFGEHVDVDVHEPSPVIDTCGTGGDRSHTVNVSTLAALVAVGAGVRVAKHGNRAASSACGSADLLEALGVVIDLGPAGVARCIDEAGIGFCFAPRFHPAMRHAGPARRALGVPTTFNFLGPLANPAGVRRQVLGVSDPAMAPRMAGALANLGVERALVFCGDDGLDELTTTTTSTVYDLDRGDMEEWRVEPVDFGLTAAAPDQLRGGDATTNADITRRVLGGEPGPVRDVVLLNAAAALVVAGAASDIGAALEIGRDAIDSGRAAAALEAFVKTSRAARDDGAGGEAP